MPPNVVHSDRFSKRTELLTFCYFRPLFGFRFSSERKLNDRSLRTHRIQHPAANMVLRRPNQRMPTNPQTCEKNPIVPLDNTPFDVPRGSDHTLCTHSAQLSETTPVCKTAPVINKRFRRTVVQIPFVRELDTNNIPRKSAP